MHCNLLLLCDLSLRGGEGGGDGDVACCWAVAVVAGVSGDVAVAVAGVDGDVDVDVAAVVVVAGVDGDVVSVGAGVTVAETVLALIVW